MALRPGYVYTDWTETELEQCRNCDGTGKVAESRACHHEYPCRICGT